MSILLSANWGQASIIALLGFLLVVVLLALLVLILILFSKIMVKSVKPVAKASSQVGAPVESSSADAVALSSEELVAIALAINLAQEPEHDKETKVLTIKPVLNSAWASKAYGINNLIR